MTEHERVFKNNVSSREGDKKKDPIRQLTQEEWGLVGELVDLLQCFKFATALLEGSKYPTLSLCWPTVEILKSEMRQKLVAGSSASANTRIVATALLEQLERRFKSAPDAAIMATYLDHRYKDLQFLDDEVEKARWLVIIKRHVERAVAGDAALVDHEPSTASASASAAATSASPPTTPTDPFAAFFSKYKKSGSGNAAATVATSKSEMEIYASESAADATQDVNPLHFWKKQAKAGRLPVLAKLAKKYLCIPASSAPSERVWSFAGIVLSKRRMRLLQERVARLTLFKHNLPYIRKLSQSV